MAEDALSDVLKTVRLTGATYFDVVAQEPWSVHSPAKDLILPRVLPGADHLIAYHVVTAGRCYASLVGGETIPLEAGEVVVFTNADPHIMSSNAGMRAEPPTADFFDLADAGRLPFHVNLANGGEASAKIVCGYLACDSRPFNPLIGALPPMLKAGDPRRNDTGWLGQFIHFAVAEVADKRAGSESVLTKLSELMFIDVVRRYIETLPPQKTGWLAGLRDPTVSKSLALIHARPSFSWTIEGLARQCGSSRSVFAERFVQLLGVPPMQYLAQWRMQVASEMLDRRNMNMAAIASEIGYESEAAFSRSFKRMMGVPPSAWRQGIRPAGPHNQDARARSPAS
ncbi:AraC family transcriptional regulator [Bradyrhizobium erythrophlei]|jgi:AraC-like DNA-binding protein|uniref:Transcriptional regulator, AraC family n=1 Tax=Bradyrhizobium erythrophlei TaxID=1437360 RepID=A0A1M7TXE2_9BRAD|nr:AraC family transcriptional regulator [Bradyrhizobium erythrophlei]SHN75414.1 transcriptional regulator, AraC family [Bradyrhizobium erythrophlei]